MRETSKTVTITTAQARYVSWASDVLVYTIVLNLFVEYVDKIVIDSFTISIFTAVVLKLLLDVLTGVEHQVHEWVAQYSKALAFVSVWLILFLSKFVILEVIDIIFGDHVELGKFWHVLTLVIALMVARELFKRLYLALGDPEPARTD